MYLRLLRQLDAGRDDGRYPGSAYIAMAVLGAAVHEYRVADTDTGSLRPPPPA
jgi:hypothetical protein